MVLSQAVKLRRLTEMNGLHVMACKPMDLSTKRLGPNRRNTTQTTGRVWQWWPIADDFYARIKRVGCPRQLCVKLWISP